MSERTGPKIPRGDREAGQRRRRYERASGPPALVALTPTKMRLLRYLAELRFLSLPQLARLVCPATRRDLSEKNARRHMRELFDAGLVDVLPVSRLALAPPDAPNDAGLLYGSAPNVYAPTRRGLELLDRAGLAGREWLLRGAPPYGPKNSLFLAHELEVRDVRVWLEAAAPGGGQRVLSWRDGAEAVIARGAEPSAALVRPDAWFVYRVTGGEAPVVLVGLVEVDRGTERGDRRWREKLDDYGALFDGERLPEVTGYRNARVLVIAPDERRRDSLAALIAGAGEALSGRFWLAVRPVTDRPDLSVPEWRRPAVQALCPLIARDLQAGDGA